MVQTVIKSTEIEVAAPEIAGYCSVYLFFIVFDGQFLTLLGNNDCKAFRGDKQHTSTSSKGPDRSRFIPHRALMRRMIKWLRQSPITSH